jgi:hypothetical protein
MKCEEVETYKPQYILSEDCDTRAELGIKPALSQINIHNHNLIRTTLYDEDDDDLLLFLLK